MVWVRNVFLIYEDGDETSFLFMGRGRNVFPKYKLGAKRLTKKLCELTMGRKICVPHTPSFHLSAQNKLTCTEEVDQNPASHKGTVMHDDLLYNIKCHVQSIEKMTDDSYIQARSQDFNV